MHTDVYYDLCILVGPCIVITLLFVMFIRIFVVYFLRFDSILIQEAQRTDGRTDGQTDSGLQQRLRLCIASRVKN